MESTRAAKRQRVDSSASPPVSAAPSSSTTSSAALTCLPASSANPSSSSADVSSGSAMRKMAEKDLSAWAAQMRAKIAAAMASSGGIAIIDDFLPRDVANELRAIVFALGPGKWALNEDDGEDDDIPHTFLSCAENISDANRILWSLMPDKLPSFSAARYMQGHGIARHDDTLTISDGSGGTLSRDTAIVLYLVDDEWSKEDGGLFLDYGKEEQETPIRTVVPKFNRLVCFNVPRDHEVTAVAVENDVERPRLSIFGWFLVPDNSN